jgi:hypothetical protein
VSAYIAGLCFTNLDDFANVDWPTLFVAVPRVGERVQGRRGTNIPSLKVIAVTHIMNRDGKPEIRVELHR